MKELRREVINGIEFLLESIPEDERVEPEERYALSMRNVGSEPEDWDETVFHHDRRVLVEDFIDHERNRPWTRRLRTLVAIRKSPHCRPDNPLPILCSTRPKQPIDNFRHLTRTEVNALRALGLQVSERWGVNFCCHNNRAMLTEPQPGDLWMMPVATGMYLSKKH